MTRTTATDVHKSMDVYKKRRRALALAMEPNSIALLPTAVAQKRNADTEFPFRHDSDFYYLTGFTEPESILVITTGTRRGQYQFFLFVRERDRKQEIWNGRRAGPAGAKRYFGADEAYSIDQLDQLLPKLLENRNSLYYPMGSRPAMDERVIGWRQAVLMKARSGVKAPSKVVALDALVHEMRLFKDETEIALMRRSAQIAAGAHRRAMQVCRPGMFEYQLEAEIMHEFLRHGARAPAYSSIVGSGASTCILHYTENNARISAGDLVLIDAGAEFNGYASDITRTFPASGTFSPEQRAVYEVVLAAQRAAIAKALPGKRWNDPHDAAVKVLTTGLVKLGLLKGKVSDLILNKAYTPFYMHRTGHWLGMDVHDVGDYREGERWRTLKPGMVMTVEPGLYISAGTKGVAKRWWNIGVRIEDDVVITHKGNEVLTRDCPKEIEEVERIVASHK